MSCLTSKGSKPFNFYLGLGIPLLLMTLLLSANRPKSILRSLHYSTTQKTGSSAGTAGFLKMYCTTAPSKR